jgi:DNA polymerase (family 10)
MHTVETDGRNTIEEMAEAAKKRGYKYIAITDHSKNLAMANGLDDERVTTYRSHPGRKQARRGITIMTGIRGRHPRRWCPRSVRFGARADGRRRRQRAFRLQPGESTNDRPLAPRHQQQKRLHPRASDGRLQLRREGYAFDFEAILKSARENQIAMELNAYPDRLDLNDVHLRMARDRGVKIVINTDAHHVSHFEKIKYGILQARRPG